LTKIEDQLLKKDQILKGRFPTTTLKGKWISSEHPNWLSGFLGGELWLVYEMTGNPELKKRAIEQADRLIQFARMDDTHDMGFIFLPTCVKAYMMTGEKKYREAAIVAARMLARRFNTKASFLRAWGKLGSSDQAGWMIVDTMMNLELLFWAAEETGECELYEIAYKHAITSMNQNIRRDFSTFHVVEFDTLSGGVSKRRTYQGFSDSSTWSRGQAWGIYGFANAYKRTGDVRFLHVAQKMADYFISRLPEDCVPYWDLELSGDTVLHDASAGAVASSGLFLLSDSARHRSESRKYGYWADRILESLKGKYLFTKGRNELEEGILLHSVYNFPKNLGVDESLPAGDFYLIEAIKREWDKKNRECLIRDEESRQVYLWNSDWYYLEEDIGEVSCLHISTKEWAKISLPHTWNVWDAVDNEPGYRRGIGWYEKELYVPEYKSDIRLVLYFEGVNITSEVFVNGVRAGGHVGGYVGFEVDITSYLRKGAYNTVQVKASNAYDPNIIPSQKSDFHIYGGITRDVWLKVLPSAYIGLLKIRTPHVSKKSAGTEVEVKIVNQTRRRESFEIKATITSRNGTDVASKSTVRSVAPGAESVIIEMSEIKNPALWSPVDPALYTMTVQLKRSNKTVDNISDRFAYRWFEFKEHGPFFLNGERLLLRGTQRHEDYAGYANAMPDSLHRQDIKMTKEIGANFLRLAHYPQDPEVYRACDELGLLVWDELPWCRGGMGGQEWRENTERLLKEQIEQLYNHPSIIIHSLGNELNWLPDFADGDNQDSLRATIKALNTLAHQVDPYRLTATRKFTGGADLVDVVSPSMWPGWYGGTYKGYEKAITEARDKFSRSLHIEYGGDSHMGRHSENPVNGEGVISSDGWEESIKLQKVKNVSQFGDWSESYIVDLFDWYLHISEQKEWFTGGAQWIFKDFPTPLRPENPIPYVNQKGLVQRDGKPKGAYYVFKSYWTTFPEFCYIESHTWTDRSGPANLKREVDVFSNCQEVELFLNGVSQGKNKRDINIFPACGLNWKVSFVEGQNKLVANGYRNGLRVAIDSMAVAYTFKKNEEPNQVVLSSERMANGNFLVTALVVDKNGQRCLDYNKRIYFTAGGGGNLLINYGTSTRSSVIEVANGKAQIELRPVPLSRTVVEARNQDFKGSYEIINN
jgi:beta-galactosidase